MEYWTKVLYQCVSLLLSYSYDKPRTHDIQDTKLTAQLPKENTDLSPTFRISGVLRQIVLAIRGKNIRPSNGRGRSHEDKYITTRPVPNMI